MNAFSFQGTMAESLRQNNKSLKRQRILETARNHFSHFGFERATLRDIARDSGVGLGTVLLYAESKHALLHQVWRMGLGSVLDDAIAASVGLPLLDGAMALFAPFLRAYHAEPELARIVIKELPWLTGSALDEHQPDLTKYLGALVGCVEAEKSRGAVRAELDSHQVAHIFFGLYYSACIELASPLGRNDLESTLRHLRNNLALVERGLVPR